jgi:hypothetical protein
MELSPSTTQDQQSCRSISVPQAGKVFLGIGRNASYQAAKNGDIPTIKVGRLLRVPIAAMERKLEAIVALADLGESVKAAQNHPIPQLGHNDGPPLDGAPVTKAEVKKRGAENG